MISSTVENYVRRLYLEQQESRSDVVSMGRLAAAMKVVPGTATSMVKALSDSGLVEYLPRAGVRLTADGQKLALHVLRRHRLIELFLVKVLEVDWSVVHEEADNLEHAISDRVLERLDALLGRPTTDPHGDPIPNASGHLEEQGRMSLADCPVGTPRKIARVLDQEPEFLQFIQRRQLKPQSTVVVESREPGAEVVKVILATGETVSLGLAAAGKILVESGDHPQASKRAGKRSSRSGKSRRPREKPSKAARV